MNYNKVLSIYFLFNQNKPKPGNRSCRGGLALGFGLHQDTGFISKHIGRYSTTDAKCVNGKLNIR